LSVQNFNVITNWEYSSCYKIIFWFSTKFKYLQIIIKIY